MVQKMKTKIQKVPNKIRNPVYKKLITVLNNLKIISNVSINLNKQINIKNYILNDIIANDFTCFR